LEIIGRVFVFANWLMRELRPRALGCWSRVRCHRLPVRWLGNGVMRRKTGVRCCGNGVRWDGNSVRCGGNPVRGEGNVVMEEEKHVRGHGNNVRRWGNDVRSKRNSVLEARNHVRCKRNDVRKRETGIGLNRIHCGANGEPLGQSGAARGCYRVDSAPFRVSFASDGRRSLTVRP
jgi:hypothetical protein